MSHFNLKDMPLKQGVTSARLNGINISDEWIKCHNGREYEKVRIVLDNAGFCWASGHSYLEYVPTHGFPILINVERGLWELQMEYLERTTIEAESFINSNTVTVPMSQTSHITTERRVITIKPRAHAVTVEDIAPFNTWKGALLTFKDSPYEELYMSFNVHATCKYLLHCFALKSHTVPIGEVVVLDYKKLQVIDDMELSLKLKQL